MKQKLPRLLLSGGRLRKPYQCPLTPAALHKVWQSKKLLLKVTGMVWKMRVRDWLKIHGWL